MEFKKISIIGLGYIGLPTAAVCASKNIKVVGVDIDEDTVNTINNGDVHIVEPGLESLVKRGVEDGYLVATTTPQAADAFLIAVPTPFKAGHEPDISYIEAAAQSIAPILRKGDLIILESTSPVGTTEQLAEQLVSARPDLIFPGANEDNPEVNIAYCPERVLPGRIIEELIKNDRIIGGMTSECTARAIEFYKIFVEGECIATDVRTAEMCKLTENTFRDVNIAFANELSIICDKLNINVWELIQLANRHPRVSILQPGPGVGGHCIAVDPWFIVNKAPTESRLISSARMVNDYKPAHVMEKIKLAAAEYDRPVIACFGLTFKPDIDDLRESPAMLIVSNLIKQDVGEVLICEPNVKNLPEGIGSATEHCDEKTAIAKADIVVLLVDHSAFKAISLSDLGGKTIIDTKGLWS